MFKMIIFSVMLIMMSMIFMFNGFYILFINKLFVYEWMIYDLNSMKMNLILVISFKLLMFMFLVMLIYSMILLYSVSLM